MEVNVIINGKSVKAKQGQTILEVAKENNIYIPTLCFLKEINQPSSCRVCVVEVEGAKNLVTSCSYKIKEGMVIKTNTQKVLNARKMAIELLLSNHNKDCTSCPKNLKCELQKLSNEYLCDSSKFDGEILNAIYDDSNGTIVRDTSKCILCGKCVAVCSQIQSVNAIGKTNRGFNTQIGTSFNKPLINTTCVGCGQCTLVCPTGALTVKNEIDKIQDILNKTDVIKVAQIAPAVRVAMSEEFGADIGTFEECKLVSALKECGFDYVFDVCCGADFTVIEESEELIKRIKSKKGEPLFTSCCHAWVKFVQKFYPEQEKNLSSCKSPSEMLASLVKYHFESLGKRVEVVSVMPCSAKKIEVMERGDISVSITTRELAKLIKLKGINFNKLEESSFDNPFGEYTSAGLIFGASGGVCEAALRYALFKLTGKKQDIIKSVRVVRGVKEVNLKAGNIELKLAIVSGLKNAKNLIEKINSGKKKFDFVEVMACTGGCINGGGQPFVDYNQTELDEVINKRRESLLNKDKTMQIKSSEDNLSVQKIYTELLKNDKKLIHNLLHYK